MVKYDVKSYGDLFRLKLRLQRVDEERCKAQEEMYWDRALQKRSCKMAEDKDSFEAPGDDYRERVEQIKIQKKDNRQMLKEVEKCLERDGSLVEVELEMRIPVDNMEDMAEIVEDNVPVNPYRGQEVVDISASLSDEVAEADMITTSEVKTVVETNKHLEVSETTANEKAYISGGCDDTKGTDSAFEMLKAYFETVGLSTDFNSVYGEAKLLTNYYEEQKVEVFIQKQTEQIIEKLDMLGIDTEQFSEYPVDVLSKAFDFGDMEYFARIKMFNRVIDKLGVNMTRQKQYKAYNRIYEEGMREKKERLQKKNRLKCRRLRDLLCWFCRYNVIVRRMRR